MVGERLRVARRLRRLSQKALAERIGITVGKLRQYERGERIPDERTLSLLAAVLRVTPTYLLHGIFGELKVTHLFVCHIDEHDPSQWYDCSLEPD